jgi:DNA-binding CsgD family transcriptional regulator
VQKDARLLLERDEAFGRVAETLEATGRGEGAVLVVEAPAGLGKTSLLAAARDQADSLHLGVLSATGSEFERAVPFGLTRQLLEREAQTASEARRRKLLAGPAAAGAPVLGLDAGSGSVGRTDLWSVLHGLFWLAANLAEGRGLVLVVDDCQWSDEASWQWLSYAARHLDGLPLGLIAAGRSDEPSAHQRRVRELLPPSHTAAPLRLTPLSDKAVTRLIATTLGTTVDNEFGRACHELTAGNPFLVVQLCKAITERLLEPNAASIAELASVVPDTVTWAVRTRLRRLGGNARAIAEALSVLGRTERLSDMAQLTDLPVRATSQAVDRLVAAEMITASKDIGFVHPLVQRALYDSIAPARRSALHRRAARSASDARAAPEVIAGHLLNAFGEGDSWAAAHLLAAATDAAKRAAWPAAVIYLRRALQEPPPDALRAEILCELGLAEERLRDPLSLEHLRAALALIDQPTRRVGIARALGRALGLEGRLPEAISVLEDGIARLPPSQRELATPLEIDIQAIARTHPDTALRADARLARLLSAHGEAAVADTFPGLMAQHAAWRATAHWSETERLAQLALADGELLSQQGPEAPQFWTKVQALGWCDQYSAALQHADAGLHAAQELGSVTGYVLGCTYRAELHYRRGALVPCEADADAALEAIDQHRLELPAALALAWLVSALIEQARLADAETALSMRGRGHQTPRHPIYAMLVHARARLLLARGDARAAQADALTAGDLLAPLGPAPTPLAWRSTAALCAHAAGDTGTARALAEEDLTLARRYGAPRALGIALRTCGLVHVETVDLNLLHESVTVLQQSEARAEYSHSLLQLGAALRRQRRVTESRRVLREALDTAHQSGAVAIEQRIRDELLAAGAKPRRPRITGEDSLTPREQRVVELAAEGLTNKQIAQQLFLTVRTVETHLSRAYRKLGTTRADLGRAGET